MAHACEKSGAKKCPHCAQADKNGLSSHVCSYYGECD